MGAGGGEAGAVRVCRQGGQSTTSNVSINRSIAAHDLVSLIHESECRISCTEAAQGALELELVLTSLDPRKRMDAATVRRQGVSRVSWVA
jgi:hypothetical protein